MTAKNEWQAKISLAISNPEFGIPDLPYADSQHIFSTSTTENEIQLQNDESEQ